MTTALVASPYGRDTSASDRIYPGRISTGVQLVGEALYRRFCTTKGRLEYDPEYGFALVTWLQSNAPTDANLLALRSQMTAEALKDERIDDVVVTITPSRAGPAVSLAIGIDVTLDTGEAFTLSLNVADVTLELLGISEAA